MKKIILLSLISLIASLIMGSEISADQKKVLDSMGFKSHQSEAAECKDCEKKDEKPVTQEKFPCEGFCSLVGPTGYITVPTEKMMSEKTVNMGMHFYYPANQGREKLARYMKFNYAPVKKLEIGACKVFTQLTGMSTLDPYFNIKYAFNDNLTLGGVFDSSSLKDDIKYHNSLFLLYGKRTGKIHFTVGTGLNYGKGNAFAHFGDANSTDSSNGFPLAAASYDITENLDFLVDYNGDICSYGLRYALSDLAIDLLVLQKGDNLAVLPVAGDSKTVIGMNLKF